ncbi:MAG: hypothetical protein K5Q00_03540, partial [Gammaproteobacteria bacterium]|nr:hypothetical protein [Gammaproteobacteria bacterium]
RSGIEFGILPEVPFADNFPTVGAVPAILRNTVSTPIWQGQPDSLEKLILDLRDGSGVMLKHLGVGYFDISLAGFLQQYRKINFRPQPEASLLQRHIFLVQLMRYFNIYSWLIGDSFFPANAPRDKINATQIIVHRLLNLYFASLFAILFDFPNCKYYMDWGLAYTFSNEEMLSSDSSSGHNSEYSSDNEP